MIKILVNLILKNFNTIFFNIFLLKFLCMDKLDNYRLTLGKDLYIPIMLGGMGVNISNATLALEISRLGGIGHISDAMLPTVCDRELGTSYSKEKLNKYKYNVQNLDKSEIKFDLQEVYNAQKQYISSVMERKKGSGAIFVNVMEKLTMGDPIGSLKSRLDAALDAGVDGITLSAGVHMSSLGLIKDNKRFYDAKIGIIVSSDRALKVFLRSAKRVNRIPDYIVIEGPLAGGHLGFGEDYKAYKLESILEDVKNLLQLEGLQIPIIVAGGIFTGSDATKFIQLGANAVQVATRFVVSKECALPDNVKQKYFKAEKEDIVVNKLSPTGYLMRMLKSSPCMSGTLIPQCELFGYMLSKEGTCQYIEAYKKYLEEKSNEPISDKMCICTHFYNNTCYTCGENAYRLKETTSKNDDGTYKILNAKDIFNDYLYSASE